LKNMADKGVLVEINLTSNKVIRKPLRDLSQIGRAGLRR